MSARFRRCFAILVLILGGLIAAPQVFAETMYSFNLPEQSLADSLRAIGQQTEMNILFEPDAVKNARSPALRGQYTVDEAIRIVLAGTKLEAQHTAASNVVIKVKSTRSTVLPATSLDPPGSSGTRLAQSNSGSPQSQSAAGPQNTDNSNSTSETSKKGGLEEIVVTGTSIHGIAPAGSPLKIYDRNALEASGATTLEEFAEKMPENFASLTPTAFAYNNSSGSFSQSRGNYFGGAGFNIHGLGPGATLTLVDGHRMSPGGVDGGFTDVSLIPLSAIERIEVLTDGASSVYGADAIGGVVNIVLRRDFQGAETSATYSAPTRGSADSLSADQMLGFGWSSGNATVMYEFNRQNPLLSDDRNFIPDQGRDVFITPSQKRNSLFSTLRQELTGSTELQADLYFADRDFDFFRNQAGNPFTEDTGKVQQYGGILTVNQKLQDDWRASGSVNYSRATQNLTTYSYGETTMSLVDPAFSRMSEVTIKADGPLFRWSPGAVKGAFGVNYRSESLEAPLQFSGIPERNISSAFGELAVPLIGGGSDQRLDLSVSGRYDHYSDFGSTTNPKVGLVWSPGYGLNLRGSYATSFAPPLLSQLVYFPFYFTFPANNPSAPGGTTDLLINSSTGVGPLGKALTAEKAKSYTFGFDFRPDVKPDLTFAATYFHVSYKDRIDYPPITGGGSVFTGTNIFTQPQLAPYILPPPSQALLQTLFNSPGFLGDLAGGGPAGVQAVFNDNLQNIAETVQQGVDAQATEKLVTDIGDFDFSVAGTYLLENKYITAEGLPPVSLRNSLGQPPDLRLSGVIAWSLSGFSSSLNVNYASSYRNTLFSPSVPIASFTVVGLQVGYQWADVPDSNFMRGFQVQLGVQNLFDRSPPYVGVPTGQVGTYNVGFDPANASPLGRVINIRLRKRW
jgi:iron complex outermembrane receptor protein